MDYFNLSDQASLYQDQPKVLLVESNIVFASSLITKLKFHGVECDFAYESKDAIKRVQEKYKSKSQPIYQLILVSHNLERFGEGIDFC